MKEINLIGESTNHSGRYGAQVFWFCLHTEEGPANYDPYRLHQWMCRNGVSYHYIVGNGVVIDHVDTDRASWSALDANSRTINLVFAGSRANMSRQEWLDIFSVDIDNAAFLFVQDAKKYDPLAPLVIGKDYAAIKRGVSGGIDHSGITYGLGIGDHTDVGKNFPFDYFKECVDRHIKGYVPPAVVTPEQQIEEQYKLTPWLGAKISLDLAIPTPDKRGRFVQYQTGYIYWTPQTGARPIPNHLFETYAELDFEQGPLGFPMAFHTVLPLGDVQAFEHGVLYRKFGEPGYFVHGLIGDRWARSGFENGPFGWPISNEVPFEGGAYQDFENGRIVWAPDGTVAMKPQEGLDYIVPATHI
jgi:hypothetical protein